MKLTRTNIHLRDDQRTWLQERKQKTGVPPAEQVRRLIDAAMRKSAKVGKVKPK